MKKTTFIFFLLAVFAGCRKIDLIKSEVAPVIVEAESVRFAVIGDYGEAGDGERAVSEMVKSWNPDFIITMGDNNYSSGKESTLYDNIGQYYCDYIYNYDAPESQRCNGKATQEMQNRFFPSPGNHDFTKRNGITSYLNYFTLPGHEDYYAFIWGPVHLFSLCSGEKGNGKAYNADQYNWLHDGLATSTQPWNLVYFHHSPYSSASHGSDADMQWPFKEWSASAVLTGHDHVYSRIVHDSLTYFINGLGGRSIYSCDEHPLDPDAFDVFCYNSDPGAMLVTADSEKITFQFFAVSNPGTPVDEYTLRVR